MEQMAQRVQRVLMDLTEPMEQTVLMEQMVQQAQQALLEQMVLMEQTEPQVHRDYRA